MIHDLLDESAHAPEPGLEATALEVARDQFDASGELPRFALIDEQSAKFHYCVLPAMRSPMADHLVMGVFRATIRDRGSVGVALCSEAWLASSSGPEGRAALPRDLSTYEGRREVVLAVVEHRDLEGGTTRLWVADITRDAAGRPTLGAWQRSKTSNMVGGNLVGMLPQTGASA